MESNRSFSLDIEEARRRLEVWRKSRSRGKRIPDRLWALAAALARTHGVSPVSQGLGLDYNGLKRRGGGAPAGRADRLWALAAALARTHGVSPVSQGLGLDYNGLKRRAEATPSARRSRLRLPPGFVELPLVAQPVFGPNRTVELARGEGARMTIRWEGKEGLDLVGLAEAFWRSGS